GPIPTRGNRAPWRLRRSAPPAWRDTDVSHDVHQPRLMDSPLMNVETLLPRAKVAKPAMTMMAAAHRILSAVPIPASGWWRSWCNLATRAAAMREVVWLLKRFIGTVSPPR